MNLFAQAVPSAVSVDPVTLLSSMVMILGTIVSLVVWLVKAQTKRQEKVTDEFLGTLKEQLNRSATTHDRYADTIAGIAGSISQQTSQMGELTKHVADQSGKIAALVTAVAGNKCKATRPTKPKPTAGD